MKCFRFCTMLFGLAALVAPATLIADDIAPAPFRGAPNSVMAKFDLFGGQVPGGPSAFSVGANATYPLDPLQPFVNNPQTTLGGDLVYPIALPNYIDDLPYKYIRIQYSWFGSTTGNTGDAATFNIFPSPGGNVTLLDASLPTLIAGPNIYHRWDDYRIEPNPDSERFEIAFSNADPRWVIIDTISVPEPSGLLFAGIISILVCARRRR